MQDRILLQDLSLAEIKQLLNSEPKFRATQVFKWLNNGADFSAMSDIPLKLRQELSNKYIAQAVKIYKMVPSRIDDTKKFLYELSDGNIIEGVLMTQSYGTTLCVSTQVGCRMGCSFCASGIGGLVRHLSAGEILGQVIAVNAYIGGTMQDRKITNLVLMGSGEPLDNYDNVTKFLRLVSAEEGINISQRNISLSTCGLADKIKRLADEGFNVTLSISLHSAIEQNRKKLMPITNKYCLADLKDAAKYYFEKTGRRVIFEYSMIKDENMSKADVDALVEMTKGFPCHINLIMLNYVKEKGHKPCTKAEAINFLKELEKRKISATIRRSMGSDIEGACGQLRRKFLDNN